MCVQFTKDGGLSVLSEIGAFSPPLFPADATSPNNSTSASLTEYSDAISAVVDALQIAAHIARNSEELMSVLSTALPPNRLAELLSYQV